MTPERRGPHRLWTEGDDNWLRQEWGRRDLAAIAEYLQRTVSSISERARKLKLQRKTMTLRAFARYAGVPISKVYWAIEQRSMFVHIQRVRRTDARQILHHGSHYALTPEQQDSLLSVIRAHPRGRLLRLDTKKTPKGLWGVGIKPDACRECESAEQPHYAKGYCKRCYVKVFKWQKNRAKNPTRTPQAGTAPKSLMVTR